MVLRTVVCPLCCERFDAREFIDHVDACEPRREAEQARLPELLRTRPGELPDGLDYPSERTEDDRTIAVFNAHARRAYRRSLPPCVRCGRAIEGSRMASHVAKCRVRGSKLAANVANETVAKAILASALTARPKEAAKALAMAKRLVVCYVCGGRVPLRSVHDHEADCREALDRVMEDEEMASAFDGNVYSTPDTELPEDEDDSWLMAEYNAEASAIALEARPFCRICKYPFVYFDLEEHMHNCIPASSASPAPRGGAGDVGGSGAFADGGAFAPDAAAAGPSGRSPPSADEGMFGDGAGYRRMPSSSALTRGAFCHLCGQSVALSKFSGHARRCAQERREKLARLPSFLRPPSRVAFAPDGPPPSVNMSDHELHEYNEQARHYFANHDVVACASCGKTLPLASMAAHTAACGSVSGGSAAAPTEDEEEAQRGRAVCHFCCVAVPLDELAQHVYLCKVDSSMAFDQFRADYMILEPRGHAEDDLGARPPERASDVAALAAYNTRARAFFERFWHNKQGRCQYCAQVVPFSDLVGHRDSCLQRERDTRIAGPVPPSPSAAHGQRRMKLLCHLCGKEFPLASYGEHLESCQLDIAAIVERLPRELDDLVDGRVEYIPEMPVPTEHSDDIDVAMFNEEAQCRYQSLLVRCDKCSRKFHVSRLAQHRMTCKGSGKAAHSHAQSDPTARRRPPRKPTHRKNPADRHSIGAGGAAGGPVTATNKIRQSPMHIMQTAPSARRSPGSRSRARSSPSPAAGRPATASSATGDAAPSDAPTATAVDGFYSDGELELDIDELALDEGEGDSRRQSGGSSTGDEADLDGFRSGEIGTAFSGDVSELRSQLQALVMEKARHERELDHLADRAKDGEDVSARQAELRARIAEINRIKRKATRSKCIVS